jgi:ADP-ribose pyrophosphatase YjhB (NUDIX family)
VNLEPQKVFVGLMDFFSILLPGALLTYLLMGPEKIAPWNDRIAGFHGAPDWAGFWVASYLVGHLVFLLGAWWLDEFYDWARGKTLNDTRRRAALRGGMRSGLVRVLVWLVFKREDNAAVARAAELKRATLAPLSGSNAINTFQWAKALLTVESAESLATVQRFEADSKFFRSFVVVLLILFGWWAVRGQWLAAVVAVALLPLALWRYMDQRLKSTNQAYWSVITLAARAGKTIPVPARTAGPAGETHAGGVVYRPRWKGTCEYLLVEAKDDPAQKVLPKGHIEPGETVRETAVREVHEEAGVWATIEGDMGVRTFASRQEMARTRFFLMRARGRGLRKDRDREKVWLAYEKAVSEASFEETKELLREAEAARRRVLGG